MCDEFCKYQKKIPTSEYAEALSEGRCEHCGVQSANLIQRGEMLQVCVEEFSCEPTSGERHLIAIPLCPSCHEKHHQDARGRHNPCPIKARQSREFEF